MVGIVQAFGFISICIQNVTCFKKKKHTTSNCRSRTQIELQPIPFLQRCTLLPYVCVQVLFVSLIIESVVHILPVIYGTDNLSKIMESSFACGYINIVGWCCKNNMNTRPLCNFVSV